VFALWAFPRRTSGSAHADLPFFGATGWLPASGFVSPFEDLRQSLAATVMPAFVLGMRLPPC